MRILIVGGGSLGSTTTLLLKKMLVDEITVIDDDYVEERNVNNSVLFEKEDVGKKKVEVLKKIGVKVIDDRLRKDNASIIKEYDVIIDGTDNLESRRIINKYSYEYGKTWIHGAVYKEIGEIGVFKPGRPCFECFLNNAKNYEKCDPTEGMISIISVISGLQVAEVMKIVKNKENIDGILRINIQKNDYRIISFKKNPNCPVCGNGEEELFEIKECKTRAVYESKPLKKLRIDFERIRKEYEVVKYTPYVMIIRIEGEEVIVNKNGILQFKYCKDTDKIRELSKKIYFLK